MIEWGPSSETQGQILGARESLNGRENMARRKVKKGEKSPWGQWLTRPVPNGRRLSGFWLGRKTQKLSGTNQKPERRRPFGTGLVRHCPQGLFSPFFTFLRAIFSRPLRLFLAPTFCPWVSEDEWGQKSKLKKIPGSKIPPPPPKKNTPMPNFPVGVKWYNTKFKNVRNWMKCLFLRNTMWICHTRHYHESSNGFEYPKNPYLKRASPWKYLPNSPSQKYPGIENCKPKKILRSSPSLEIRSTPPPPRVFVRFKTLH